MTAAPWRALVLLVLAAALAGCGRPSPARFIPPGEAARTALVAALESWRRGEPHGEVPGTSGPVVHFLDTHHKPNQRLAGFEVLTMAGDGPRVFIVRLLLEGPSEEVRARYVVVGLDPVWVMHQDDYDMMAHWDHPMKKP